ncbi:MAG: ATP-binding protein [Micropruina sp.]|uniref:sensor histidine kinase n=1 Tax=Micropruina sp. TaxID=2737536 RepID=UPI0039E3F812
MSPLVASALGVVLGVLATLLGLTVWRTRQQASSPDPAPLVSPALQTTIEHLRGAAALIGPHDEILAESHSAASSGVLRGNRLAHPEVLELVRDARREAEPGVLNIDVPTGLGLPGRRLAVRVSPLGDGLVLLVADDRSEALRIDETRRDFVANVTHELKTPIGALSLLAEAITDAADDPDAVRHFAGRMSTETERLNELISQIIALSRLQSSDPLLAAVPIELDEVLNAVLDQFREQAGSRRITLTRQRCPGAVIRGDRSQIEAALRNLVQNAIAYSDAGARVAISVRRVHDATGDWVEASVSDNGIGISDSDQPRVFERFFRVDYGRSRAHGGTGLGLSIVKHIAAAHGGTVSLWSRLGQGSTFTLRLPALRPDTDAEGTAA